VYPVVSLLRRTAAHTIYVPPTVSAEEGTLLGSETPTSYLSLRDGAWEDATTQIPILEVLFPGASAMEAAIAASVWENSLAEKGRVSTMLYTLLLGPEEIREVDDGSSLLVVRLAVVRGIYRGASAKLVPVRDEGRRVSVFSSLPEGSVSL